MKRILEAWNSYKKEILIPAGAGSVQIQETRRAFYAGAQSLLAAILNMLDADKEPTEADLRKMDEIQAEFNQFIADVKAGRA